jgi:hypothetical protein
LDLCTANLLPVVTYKLLTEEASGGGRSGGPVRRKR